MARNNDAGRPLVQGCGDYIGYTDAGVIWYDEANFQWRCFYPGVHGLQNIAEFYPNAAIVHIKRNTTTWVRSARKWGNILGRMAAHCDGFPRQATERDNTVTDDVWGSWYDNYTATIRNFAHQNPSMTYIESTLESPDAPAILENGTGISRNCFGHHHKTSDVIKKKDAMKVKKTFRVPLLRNMTVCCRCDPHRVYCSACYD